MQQVGHSPSVQQVDRRPIPAAWDSQDQTYGRPANLIGARHSAGALPGLFVLERSFINELLGMDWEVTIR